MAKGKEVVVISQEDSLTSDNRSLKPPDEMMMMGTVVSETQNQAMEEVAMNLEEGEAQSRECAILDANTNVVYG